MPGSEAVAAGGFGGDGGPASGWINLIVAAQPGAKPADFNLAEERPGIWRPFHPSPTTTIRRSIYSTATFTCWNYWSKKADAKNPDLSKFRKQGGKLLMTHGRAVPILSR